MNFTSAVIKVRQCHFCSFPLLVLHNELNLAMSDKDRFLFVIIECLISIKTPFLSSFSTRVSMETENLRWRQVYFSPKHLHALVVDFYHISYITALKRDIVIIFYSAGYLNKGGIAELTNCKRNVLQLPGHP